MMEIERADVTGTIPALGRRLANFDSVRLAINRRRRVLGLAPIPKWKATLDPDAVDEANAALARLAKVLKAGR